MHYANGVVWEAVSGSSLTSIRRTDSSTALSCAASQSRPMFVDTTAARTDAFAAARSASSCRSRASGDVSSDTVFNAAAKKEPMEFHAGSCADDAAAADPAVCPCSRCACATLTASAAAAFSYALCAAFALAVAASAAAATAALCSSAARSSHDAAPLDVPPAWVKRSVSRTSYRSNDEREARVKSDDGKSP